MQDTTYYTELLTSLTNRMLGCGVIDSVMHAVHGPSKGGWRGRGVRSCLHGSATEYSCCATYTYVQWNIS